VQGAIGVGQRAGDENSASLVHGAKLCHADDSRSRLWRSLRGTIAGARA